MVFSPFSMVGVFLWALLSAALEVNIEGPHGWAKSLPTVRRARERGPMRVVQMLIMGGRPVTGYHLCMFALQFGAFHLCYVQGVPFTWSRECLSLEAFFLVCPTWDFLWFVLNPAYGLKKFTKHDIEWHSDRWWLFGKFPVDYAVAALLSLLCAFITAQPQQEPLHFINVTGNYLLWAALTYLTADLIGPWYRRRRVRLLAENDPPIVETNVDDGDLTVVAPDVFDEEPPPSTPSSSARG